MSTASRGIYSKAFLDNRGKVFALCSAAAGNLLERGKCSSKLRLQLVEGLSTVHEVVQNTREECGGGDDSSHHESIDMRSHFFFIRLWSCEAEHIVQEVFWPVGLGLFLDSPKSQAPSARARKIGAME